MNQREELDGNATLFSRILVLLSYAPKALFSHLDTVMFSAIRNRLTVGYLGMIVLLLFSELCCVSCVRIFALDPSAIELFIDVAPIR